MTNNINDIPADESVVTNIWIKMPTGNAVSCDGLSEKRFLTEDEAEAFKLGVEFTAERLGSDIITSDVKYSSRYAEHYVVRTAIGKALEVWYN